MKVYGFEYEYTKYVRTNTLGGMDSEFSHIEISTEIYKIMSPSFELAEAYLKVSHINDKKFKIINTSEDIVNAVIGVDHGLGFNTRN